MFTALKQIHHQFSGSQKPPCGKLSDALRNSLLSTSGKVDRDSMRQCVTPDWVSPRRPVAMLRVHLCSNKVRFASVHWRGSNRARRGLPGFGPYSSVGTFCPLRWNKRGEGEEQGGTQHNTLHLCAPHTPDVRKPHEMSERSAKDNASSFVFVWNFRRCAN